ncbi:hypothetical protein NA56DRAFT_661245 [Hyaloscypha hepaticicola]|uniref:Uncharacterized protein n=1 Tax=Hyaloscypha hepaticicola TaxID=2082293 RepID=A0A2J6PX32_9HELO|nr:hypothetical protein NA56DRAFT_661245 [Hyaloscypha hepaticicola]
MDNQERKDGAIFATFGEWYLMIKEPIDAIADYLTRAEALIIYADNYLAYLGRPEFPQSYHNLWKAHIQAMRTLQQTSFDFLPSTSGTDSGRLSLQDYIRTTHDTHVLIYPELDEYRRYRRILQSYSGENTTATAFSDLERHSEVRSLYASFA